MTDSQEYRVSASTVRLPEILWEGVCEVPWHQREFDWDPEHIEQFWDDIQRKKMSGLYEVTLTQEDFKRLRKLGKTYRPA